MPQSTVDQETRPFLGQRTDRLRIEAIALVLAAGDVGLHSGPLCLQRLHKDGDGGYTVDVIVTVDDDKLATRQRVPDQRHRLRDPIEGEGVAERRGTVQESAGGLRVDEPPTV